MPYYRTVTIDGVARLVSDDPPAPPRNPPLKAMNDAYIEDETVRRSGINDLLEAAKDAMQIALTRPKGSPLKQRGTLHLPKAQAS